MFDDMLNDEIYVIKAHRPRQGPFKTAIGKGKATVFDTSIDVDPGDKIERALPGGKAESYAVRDVEYSPGLGGAGGIPPHYTIDLIKEGVKPRAAHHSTTINISGSSGFQVGDYNQMNVGTAIAELINEIDKNPDAHAKAEAKGKLKTFLEHPLVSTLLGAGVTTLLGKL